MKLKYAPESLTVIGQNRLWAYNYMAVQTLQWGTIPQGGHKTEWNLIIKCLEIFEVGHTILFRHWWWWPGRWHLPITDIHRQPLQLQNTHTDLFFELDSSLVVHGISVIVGHTVVDNELKVITEFINRTVLLTLHLGSHCGKIHWVVYILQVVWHLLKEATLTQYLSQSIWLWDKLRWIL